MGPAARLCSSLLLCATTVRLERLLEASQRPVHGRGHRFPLAHARHTLRACLTGDVVRPRVAAVAAVAAVRQGATDWRAPGQMPLLSISLIHHRCPAGTAWPQLQGCSSMLVTATCPCTNSASPDTFAICCCCCCHATRRCACCSSGSSHAFRSGLPTSIAHASLQPSLLLLLLLLHAPLFRHVKLQTG